jgi:hypothetical protein
MNFDPLTRPPKPGKPRVHAELAGSLPLFPSEVGANFIGSADLPSFQRKQLVFGRLSYPGCVHVYRAECRAGERLRVQVMTPVLGSGGAVTPAVAVVAQSLPYANQELPPPLPLPKGYSAVTVSPPSKLLTPVRDLLTRACYFPGPVIDTRTLVGGRCYIVVWSPQKLMGKYVLHVGHSWSWSVGYWLASLHFWWQIRGWFGLSRRALVLALLSLLALGLVLGRRLRRRAGSATGPTVAESTG